jgi:hypothetical protein
MAVAAEPVEAVQAGALVRAEASVPVPVSAQGQGLVLPVCLVLKERGRQAGQPQAEAGQVELASTWAAYPWVYQPEVFFLAQVFLSMTPRHSLSAETPAANRHRHKNGQDS